ncbi:MAG TPA: hypothetical protein VFE78_37850 [Gemmataceae bacterium]|jgi:hypothetical protein|nr:hypothetical protein [Gemmataceae bacterium]
MAKGKDKPQAVPTAPAPAPPPVPVPPPPPALGPASDLPVSFRTILWIDVGITAVTFFAHFFVALRPQEQLTDILKNFAEGCSSIWKVGAGGFFGLLFGKGTK